MFLLDAYFNVPALSEAMIFVIDNIDLIERSIAKADMIFEAYFTDCWIQMEDE
jgi:hypothetical protein